MQVTTCQWSLVIQLLEFHNSMNIEIKEDSSDEILYCCCDDHEGSTCASKSIFYNNTNNCADKCDIFFLLSLSDESSDPHSISTIKGTIINSLPHSPYGYIFSFVLHDIPNLVRHISVPYKMSTMSMILKVHEYVCITFLFRYSSIST